jgi:hypothetical protein
MFLKSRWLPGVALLIAGAAVLVPDGPARRWLVGDSPKADSQAGGRAGFRHRPSRTTATTDPNLRRALATLAGTGEEDLSAALEAITAGWPVDELGKTVTALFAKESTDASYSLLREELLRRWMGVDPAAAAAWASSEKGGALPPGAVEQVALAWSASDPDAAWNWALGLPPGADRDAALLSLSYELCRDDPARALARFEDLAEGTARDQFVEHAIANLAIGDPETALEHAQALADPLVRNQALAAVGTSWAESDPVAAATFVANGMEPGPAQERAVAAIVQRWAQQDPAAVRAWIEEFPDGSLKDNALGHLAAATASVEESTEAR